MTVALPAVSNPLAGFAAENKKAPLNNGMELDFNQDTADVSNDNTAESWEVIYLKNSISYL